MLAALGQRAAATVRGLICGHRHLSYRERETANL